MKRVVASRLLGVAVLGVFAFAPWLGSWGCWHQWTMTGAEVLHRQLGELTADPLATMPRSSAGDTVLGIANRTSLGARLLLVLGAAALVVLPRRRVPWAAPGVAPLAAGAASVYVFGMTVLARWGGLLPEGELSYAAGPVSDSRLHALPTLLAFAPLVLGIVGGLLAALGKTPWVARGVGVLAVLLAFMPSEPVYEPTPIFVRWGSTTAFGIEWGARAAAGLLGLAALVEPRRPDHPERGPESMERERR